VLHLQRDLVAVARAAAVEDQLLAALQDPGEKSTAEERGGAEAAGVPQEQHERRARAAGRRRTDAGDGPGARHDLPGLDGGERREAGPVLVTDGDEEQRILDGGEALPGE